MWCNQPEKKPRLCQLWLSVPVTLKHARQPWFCCNMPWEAGWGKTVYKGCQEQWCLRLNVAQNICQDVLLDSLDLLKTHFPYCTTNSVLILLSLWNIHLPNQWSDTKTQEQCFNFLDKCLIRMIYELNMILLRINNHQHSTNVQMLHLIHWNILAANTQCWRKTVENSKWVQRGFAQYITTRTFQGAYYWIVRHEGKKTWKSQFQLELL